MGERGEARRGRPFARRDLEDVAIAVGVVGDHVENERADDAHAGRVVGLAVFLREREPLLDERFGEVARPEAVGGELLARQVDEPDVPLQLPVAREREENVGRQQQRRRRRMVVVGAARRSTQAIAAAPFFVDVLHVRRVVVIAHDHRLAAILPRDDEHDVALARLAGLVLRPTDRPWKVEVGLPGEDVVHRLRAPLHAVSGGELAVAGVKVIPEQLEVASLHDLGVCGLRRRSPRLAAVDGDAVGVFLLTKLPLGQASDRSPQPFLELPRARPVEREWRSRLRLRPERRAKSVDEVRGPTAIGRAIREVPEPLFEAGALGDAQERSCVRWRERFTQELARLEQPACVEARREKAAPALVGEERRGLSVAVACEQAWRERERRRVSLDRLGGDVSPQGVR